jgi:hypothetical protein
MCFTISSINHTHVLHIKERLTGIQNPKHIKKLEPRKKKRIKGMA